MTHSSPVEELVTTVMGNITSDKLGITLMHEHLHSDLDWPGFWPKASPMPDMLDDPVRLTNLGLLRRDPFVVRDNSRNTDVELTIQEVNYFKKAGGATIVELTPIGMYRNPRALLQIAEATGLNIIMGSGWYIAPTHPSYIENATVEELTEILIREINSGVDDTGIKPGIIGEIGTSGPVTDNEKKTVRAALRAHKETGLAINIHFSSRDGGVGVKPIMKLIRDESVNPARVVFSHMDIMISPSNYLAAADEGFLIEFDTFGPEQYFMLHAGTYSSLWYQPTDLDRIKLVTELVDRGHIDQLLISQDIYLKIHLKHYGGWGYDHILSNIVPMLLRSGITYKQISTILVDNPARVLPVQA